MKKILKFFIQYYLKLLVKIVLWRHKPMIIAISGTTNKTFIKDLILKEIGDKMDVRGNPKSFNTEIGLPLAVLFLSSGYSSFFKWTCIIFEGFFVALFSRKFPKVLVLEMGVDCRGDMSYLLSIVKPAIAIITNVDRSFFGNDTSIDDVVDEMRQLVKSIKKEGKVFLNGDDERVKALAKDSRASVVTWGASDDCIAKILNVKETEFGQSFILKSDGKEEMIEIKKFGYHNISATVVTRIVTKEILKKKK
jgi:UDP-N-acetylmuramoyl-tripeptide--D-alanyl-D-alanine ligase